MGTATSASADGILPDRPRSWDRGDPVDLREHAEEIVWAATRAPSYRDTQPWSFRVAAHQVEVYADLSRSWPVADREDRQLYLTIGAAVFGVRLAMAELGVRPVIGISRDPLRRDLAAIVASAGASRPSAEDDRLYTELTRRRTVRTGSLHGAVPADLRAHLADIARHEGGVSSRWLSRATDRTTICELIHRTAADLRPEIGSVHRGGAEPPSLLVICTPTDHRADWLQAGQAAHHVLLDASASGFAASFLNELLEVPLLRERLRVELDLPGRPQVMVGLGRTEDPPPPPTGRRPVADVLRRE